MYVTLTHGTTTMIFDGRIPAEYAAYKAALETCTRNAWDFTVKFSHTVDRLI